MANQFKAQMHDAVRALPRKTDPNEVGNFGLRGWVCARLAGTIVVNVTQVTVSGNSLEPVALVR